MDPNQTPPAGQPDETNSLESPDPDSDAGALETTPDNVAAVDATTPANNSAGAPAPQKGGVKQTLRHFNIYLLLFLLVLLVAVVIIIIAYFQSKKATTTSTIKTQALTQSALQQVANSDATVGNSQQILNVQSSAVFAGKVLVRQDLEVAGNLQIGGTVGLTSLVVSGITQLGQAQINKNLAVAGDTALQGTVTIAKSLQVSSSGSFSGPVTAPQITTSSLQLNSDLTLTHHIIAGGGTPSRSGGPALGSGGSASVSGSDTAGTVSINVGGGGGAGCFVTVNFTQKYNNTPHILLTPVGSGAAGVAYYVNRTSTSFSICDSSPAAAGSSFAFDYFVID